MEELVSNRTSDLEIAIRELESFSYSVSHDLRSPLRSIDGFSQLILEDYGDKLNDEGKDYIKRVRTAAQHMAQLIDDILLLSRVSRHKLNINTVDLSDLAEASANALKGNYQHNHVDLAIEPGIKAKGDERLLKIVIDNLLDNALKYTSTKPNSRIEFACTNQNSKPIYYIKDNGVGFDMQYANKLFGAFQRLHTADEFPGTGIGLATVHRIVDRHGVQVWADGQPGEGATFYFTLH